MNPAPVPARAAFTLVELMVVITITAILAACVMPALAGMNDSRQSSAWRDVERRLVTARTLATANGRGFGVRVTASAGTFELLEIPAAGGAPVPARDAMGQAMPAWNITAAYPSTSITSFVGGDGVSGAGIVWFGYDGTPQRRNSSGTLLGGFTQDAVITLTGSRTVTVRRTSGMVER